MTGTSYRKRRQPRSSVSGNWTQRDSSSCSSVATGQ